MLLHSFAFRLSVTGYNHLCFLLKRPNTSQHIVWNPLCWLQLDSWIWIWNNVLNKGITRNLSNYTQEMTYGPVYFFNVTYWWISAQVGDLLRPNLVGLNNHYQSLRFTHQQLHKLIYSWLPPKRDSKQSPIISDISTDPPPVLSDSDSDESSTSSSSNSSTEDQSEEIDATVMALNEKTHVIHAVRVTNPDSSKRSCFKIKDTNYEVVCGSSVLNAPVKFVPEIPVGAKVCQRKACVSAIGQFIH